KNAVMGSGIMVSITANRIKASKICVFVFIVDFPGSKISGVAFNPACINCVLLPVQLGGSSIRGANRFEKRSDR
ncbi:MAG: hypothetical protein PVG78_16675, partial [Desulfobacterales bacterium]